MRKSNNIKSLALVLMLVITTTVVFAKDPGLNAFYQGDYKKSSDYYDARLKKDHDNEKLMYNRGTVALAEKDLETAESLLKQSLASKNESQLSKSYYNLGQINIQQQETEEALENFKKSMLYDPDNADAKIMYEQLQQMMQEQQQEQQQDQESGDQSQDSNDQQDQESGDKSQENDDQQDQENQQDQQDQEQQQEDQQQQDQKQQDSQLSEDDLKGEELSKEQAKNILNAMKEDEKESMKKLILSKARSKKIKRSKEW